MTIVLSLPDLPFDIQSLSVGFMVAGCLLVAFLVLALGFGIFEMVRMRRRMDLLEDETRERRAQDRALEGEEDLCGVGSGHPASDRTVSKQMKDPWQS